MSIDGTRAEGAAENSPAQVAKGRERLEVLSGHVLVIDQFMLGNEQFLSLVGELDTSASGWENSVSDAAVRYGGCVLGMSEGTYRVYRDPQQNIIALSKTQSESADSAQGDGVEDSEQEFDFEPLLEAKGNLASVHHVFVDTRCLVFLDASLLARKEFVDRFGELRSRGREKEARDLVRENGGAVRYGFNRYGDELGVFELSDENLVALWPDVIE